MSGESLFALVLKCLLPGADEVLVQAERASGLNDGVALFGDELDGLDLELAGVGASDFCHNGPPKSEFTLLTRCPPFVGRSNPLPLQFEVLPPSICHHTNRAFQQL